ncbi:glycerol-3-phosphate 1-O-acyltransferase PlsY [Fulvimarina sp. 2208YS6-2-32]|uniref:Glycerol-3-phosphate acyltransferase n=1 Tax=Fulvimarina uroteuthidis TaxID=3098149 RepID=A0ABU5I340_9HYPH|nr:glycerol-3-phosphate 1-O-acyltransferase PlsY [Fulvimarina sp. 2208YS6-2-32]MDY8109774.1 glycerol-3-phosphate 1-O-acyltransferase PlsY [Fulvimarina sp. 2208YS6-2-32]
MDMLAEPLQWALAAFVGYLSGSVPYGLLFARLFGLGDIRKIGSGNIGATNALRTGNKTMAFLTLLGDVFKATVPVLIFMPYGVTLAAIAGLAAFIGHCYPVWLRFGGGKGVATYIGVLFGLSLWLSLVFALVWIVLAYVSRYSSLAALAATLAVPLAALMLGLPVVALYTGLMTALVFWRHRANIRRLVDGREGKIGAKG